MRALLSPAVDIPQVLAECPFARQTPQHFHVALVSADLAAGVDEREADRNEIQRKGEPKEHSTDRPVRCTRQADTTAAEEKARDERNTGNDVADATH